MYPFLVDVRGVLAVSSRDAFVALAAIVCLSLAPPLAERLEGMDRKATLRALLFVAVAVFAGGKLHFVLNHWSLFEGHPLNAFKLWTGGMHAGGAVIALCIFLPLTARRYTLPLGALADAIVPTVGIGIAIARTGCFLFGCCFGITCSWPWCISYPEHSYVFDLHHALGLVDSNASRSASVHPLPLYFAAVGLAISTGSLIWYRRKVYDGQVALLALLGFSATAAGLEFLRAGYDGRPHWFGIPQLALIAACMSAFALSALAISRRPS